MSFYQNVSKYGAKIIGLPKLFKWAFNVSPMYRRSTARIQSVSEDLSKICIKLPISYKNKNYMGTIFGGSMFSSVDPIPMVQLIYLTNHQYVIWDKSAEIYFKRPANNDLYAEFIYTKEELDEIKERIKTENEIVIVKTTQLTDKNKETLYCEIKKTIYIADKNFYKQKRELKKQKPE
ncbi:DUF4442 domain-containing protein [Chryseobacterium lathyri]|jgi:hypothetical protein|uniref:DUF4442 domain-containing protein n=1 Tax=Chryseobacterium lathyri TaxID=395933 RepID=A0A511Y671_9FLAO|nr:DUF4442 domain-containing protein [Chryseobacterium lathyri]GEN70701.1 hypothetical protein CLA01_07730 [Chryseobacterium lathyri]